MGQYCRKGILLRDGRAKKTAVDHSSVWSGCNRSRFFAYQSGDVSESGFSWSDSCSFTRSSRGCARFADQQQNAGDARGSSAGRTACARHFCTASRICPYVAAGTQGRRSWRQPGQPGCRTDAGADRDYHRRLDAGGDPASGDDQPLAPGGRIGRCVPYRIDRDRFRDADGTDRNRSIEDGTVI